MASFLFIDVTVTVSYGGVQTAVWHLAKELHDQGHRVAVFGGQGSLSPDLGGRAIDVQRFPFLPREKIPNLGSRFQRIGERLSLAVAARQALLAGGYDWAILTKPFDFFWPWIVPRGCRTRFAFRSGGTDFFPGDRFLARRIDAWFTNSHFNAYQIQQRYRRALPSWPTVIYNGVDVERFAPGRRDEALRQRWGVQEGEVLFAFAGRLVGWKGLHLAIQAMAHPAMVGRPAKLLILGSGPERQPLARLAERLAQGGRVIFLDSVPHHQLPPFYASADVGLFPSIGDEGFSNSMAEAMACGHPVIATAFSGNPETVGNEGQAGLLVPPRQVEPLALAMQLLVDDPLRRARMGEAARQRILTHFTWPLVVRRLLDGLESGRAG
ncbi:MAG: glycosyltransferase family 4 protein [Magnetococcales bacterium]|nr:glycosyltransferase family 4 protein [Magnetococcales bacterium]